MELIYENRMSVGSSCCGADGRMSVTGAVNVFMDAATLHAEQLGVIAVRADVA